MRELTPLEEGFLYADSRRTTFGHSGLFIRFDASATPWDELALDAVRDQVAERLADIPPLRWRLAPNPSARRQHCLVDEGGGGSRQHRILRAVRQVEKPLTAEFPQPIDDQFANGGAALPRRSRTKASAPKPVADGKSSAGMIRSITARRSACSRVRACP